MFDSIQAAQHPDGFSRINALVNAWIDEDEYSPAYDSAVRDWARTSARAAKTTKLLADGAQAAQYFVKNRLTILMYWSTLRSFADPCLVLHAPDHRQQAIWG